MTGQGDRLAEALVGVYRSYVRSAAAKRSLDEPHGWEAALEEGESWLAGALPDLLSRPFPMQDRGPLELFQEAMRFPTEALLEAGHPPADRDRTARNALPGDIYDLAPVSPRELGEEVWRAHLAWGAAKAVASRRPRVGLLTRNLMDRSKLEIGMERQGWATAPLSGAELAGPLDGIIVDLEHPAAMALIAAAVIPCIAYGPHVDTGAFEQARRNGADVLLARSAAFRDVGSLAARLQEARPRQDSNLRPTA